MRKAKLAATLVTPPSRAVLGRGRQCFRAAFIATCCVLLLRGSASMAQHAIRNAADPTMVAMAQEDEAGALAQSKSDATQNVQADELQLKNATSLAKAGDYQSAERSIRAYLLTHADSAEGHYLLGYLLYKQNKPTDSLAEYTQGARFRKPSAADLAAVAMDYLLLQADTDADKWLTQATSMEPTNGLYWYYLGRTKYNENRFQESVDAFRKSLEVLPRNVRAEYNLGLAYAGKGLDDKARESYETAIAWQKGSAHEDPQPYLDLGMLLANQGHLKEAVPNLERAVGLDAQNPKIHEEMGHVYEQLHELGKAQSEFEAAVALAPKVSSLHFQLGRIYQSEGMTERAKGEFARCAVLNGTHSTDSLETPNSDLQP